MYNTFVVEQLKAFQYGNGKFLNQINTETLIVVLSDELVDVHTQQLERYADMSSKEKVIVHMYHVIPVLRILLKYML